MSTQPYRYIAEPTHKLVQSLSAVWQFLRRDLETAHIADAAVIQIGFNRSRLGRRIARWKEAVETWRRENVGALLEAFSIGLQSGKRAQPLLGVARDDEWTTPIAGLRDRFQIDPDDTLGRGIRIAA